jgi:fluoride exporter
MSHERPEDRLDRAVEADLRRMPVDPDVTPVACPPPAPRVRELVAGCVDLLPVIAVGGALGSLARWGLAEAFPHAADEVAWGTVIANLVGSLLLGLLMAFVLDVWSHRRYVRPFLGVGVLGGFTTFSTYELDTRGLLAAGRPLVALAYAGGSLLGALVAVVAGVVVGRAIIDRVRVSADGSEGAR